MPPENEEQRATILLVDDQEELRRFVCQVLQRRGFEVLEADSGAKALEIAENGQKIHLLLSNIQMPGITGVELATQINLKRPEIKIMLMSGFPSGILVLDRGWQFIHKPFLPDRLIEKVRSLLDDQQQGLEGLPPLPDEEKRPE